MDNPFPHTFLWNGTDSKLQESLAQQQQHHLLVVPRSDVSEKEEEEVPPKRSFNIVNSTNDKLETSSPKLLLLQLPSTDWTIDDLRHAKLIVSPDKPASFVVEGHSDFVFDLHNKKLKNKGGQSFALHKVETSNAIVLVPPTTTTHSDDDKPKKLEQPETKRAKTLNLQTTCARLMQQGSGASFLELRPQALILKDLYTLMKQSSAGKNSLHSIHNLAAQLGTSRVQVQRALHSTPLKYVVTTMQCPANGEHEATSIAGLWNSILLHDIETALIATLVEEYPDFASNLLVIPTDLAAQILTRMPRVSLPSDNDRDTTLLQQIESWLERHLYRTDEQGHVAGNVEYVARVVVRMIFESAPSIPQATLWERWRLEMPGTCHLPTTRWLQGLAVSRLQTSAGEIRSVDKEGKEQREQSPQGGGGEEEEEVVAWVYLPLLDFMKSEMSVIQALQRLAQTQKKEWSKYELEPYVEFWSAWWDVPTADMYSKFQITSNEQGQEVYSLPDSFRV